MLFLWTLPRCVWPLPAPTDLAKFDHLLTWEHVEHKFKDKKNKSIVRWRNGGKMSIRKHREEWRAWRDEASDVFVAVSI